MSLDWTSIIRRHGVTAALDVGANIGGFLETWMELGAREVVAVEPVPECFQMLVQRFGSDPRVRAFQIGVSDVPGKLDGLNVHNCWTLLPDLKNGGTPTDHGVGRALEFVGKPSFAVEFTTIDQLLDRLHFAPDFIKIDVDGYDAKALRGAHVYLAARHPLVMLEISYLPKLLGDDCEAMIRGIFDLGYRIVSVVTGAVFDDVGSFMKIYPWHTSFDVLLLPPGFDLQ